MWDTAIEIYIEHLIVFHIVVVEHLAGRRDKRLSQCACPGRRGLHSRVIMLENPVFVGREVFRANRVDSCKLLRIIIGVCSKVGGTSKGSKSLGGGLGANGGGARSKTSLTIPVEDIIDHSGNGEGT